MAARIADDASIMKLIINGLQHPFIRCLIIILILTTSTGPLILRLVSLTTRDLVVFTVGAFWLLGDILPTVGLLLLIYDLLIYRATDPRDDITIYGLRVNLSHIITIVFVLLYTIDACLSTYNLVNSNNQSLNLHQTSKDYRYLLFNIQITISILYLLKVWRWPQFDLRVLMGKLDKSFILLHKMSKALQDLLTNGPRKSPDESLPVSSKRKKKSPDLPITRGEMTNTERGKKSGKISISETQRKRQVKQVKKSKQPRTTRAPQGRQSRSRGRSSRRQVLSKGCSLVKTVNLNVNMN